LCVFTIKKAEWDMKIKTSNTVLHCRKWKESVAFYKTKIGLHLNSASVEFAEDLPAAGRCKAARAQT